MTSYYLLRGRKFPVLCWSLENQSKSLWYNEVRLCECPLVPQISAQRNAWWITGRPVMCNLPALCVPSGPFVMTTEEEIRQAVSDFQTARNGFERAKNWRSRIRDSFWTQCILALVEVLSLLVCCCRSIFKVIFVSPVLYLVICSRTFCFICSRENSPCYI